MAVKKQPKATLDKRDETLTLETTDSQVKIPWEFSDRMAQSYVGLHGFKNLEIVAV